MSARIFAEPSGHARFGLVRFERRHPDGSGTSFVMRADDARDYAREILESADEADRRRFRWKAAVWLARGTGGAS